MPSKKSTLIITLLVIISLYLIWQYNHAEMSVESKTPKSNNRDTAKPIITPEQFDQKKLTQQIKNHQSKNHHSRNSQRETTQEHKEHTYLSLYKMHRLKGDCLPISGRDQKSIEEDIINVFAEYVSFISKNRQQVVTELQSETLDNFIDACKFLHNQTKDFKPSPTYNHNCDF